MTIRFYIDPETDLPHIYNHNVSEDEVEDILRNPGVQSIGREDTLIAVGQTPAGRYLQGIFKRDSQIDSVFVITAYEIRGQSLKTYRRRRRGK